MALTTLSAQQPVADSRSARRAILIATTDHLAARVVDLMLTWAVPASAAYWIVLLLRLPVWSWYPTAAVFGVMAWRFLRPRALNRWRGTGGTRWTWLLAAICLASAAVNVFTNRPDGDDIAFSHRAVYAASTLNQPLALGDTSHDIAGLPPLTPLHVFTSVEVTTALVARALHVPQILAVHQGLGTVVNLMLPLVYFLLLRFCRVPVPGAVLGTLAVMAMFLMSGNAHRDWGNFTVLRSWQGKCILVELMVPLAVLFSLRYVQFGRRRDFLRLHAVIVAGIGLSGTGLFLIPFVVGVAAVGAWLATRLSRVAGIRMCRSASVLLFPALVAVLPWIGLLPKVGDISFYQSGGWPTAYLDNLSLVYDGKSALLDAALLGVAIIIGRRSSQLAAILAYLFLCALLLTAPGSRDVLMHIVTPGAYWRFAYVFVAPLWAGLAAAALFRQARRPGARRACSAAITATLIAGTVWAKVPTLDNGVISRPGLKFVQQDLVAAEQLATTLDRGAVVLADYRVVTILGLLRPDVRFIDTRPGDTGIIFTNGGLAQEGALRDTVGSAIVTCNFSTFPALTAAQTWSGLRAVVTPAQCQPLSVRRALGLPEDWRETVVSGYRVWMR